MRPAGGPARRWGATSGGLGFAVVGTAAIAAAAVLMPGGRPGPVPAGEPVSAQTAYRTGLPPTSRALVCPDLGAAGRVANRVDLARLGTAGRVTAALVGAGADSGQGHRSSGQADGAAAHWRPPSGPLLGPDESRGALAVPGAQEPPIALPAAPDLSTLAGLPADQLDKLSALKARSDQSALEALAALSPADRAGLAARVAPPDLSALAGLSATDRAGLTRLAVSAGRPMVLRGSAVSQLSATVTAPGGGSGPVRAACAPTGGTAWFAGPATGAGHDPLLFATNLGSQPARITVRVLTPGQAPASTELAVAPGATVSHRIAAVAPEAAATVVDVEARAGRVRSWLVDRPSNGVAWDLAPVPDTAAPGGRVLLGPVVAPSGAGGATTELVVAAPGADARVRVRVVTNSGHPVSPAGLDDIAVPGGEAVAIPVTLPRAEAAAVLVDALGPAPVVAGLGLAAGAVDPDTSATPAGGPAGGYPTWVSGTPLLAAAPADGGPDRPADRPPVPYVDVPPVPADGAGALLLAAPAGTATVRVDGYTVSVPAGRAVRVPLPARYAGGGLTVLAGPVAVTELLGAAGKSTAAPDPKADPAALGDPTPTTVSSVLPLAPPDPIGPAVLVDDPAAG
ncbi:DUF5719 family protein [Pseudofrankia inefficax]|uniref:Uncharacterized protein n=1 Tax=Pseudofrankia inefficax (strain DSM 45817 / CECT 9037 / DDB 130130 / EuI1c) TaxID=298654 RepID=E3J0Y5_PSEI1|nr:DUF5719 family protein [Pseudofrankia inefficax]ADP84049.1 hypothetical protein FraEuI1c_6065 [Pseudofrankia inefficax]